MKPSELNALIGDETKSSEEREQAIADKAVLINRVGEKIRSMRDGGKLTGQLFADFRESLYSIPEDDREAAVDAKIAELGQ